jgi:hypothetical protein
MPRRSDSKRYTNLDGQYQYQDERASTPWYWRFIASVASWMILAGYVVHHTSWSLDRGHAANCEPATLFFRACTRRNQSSSSARQYYLSSLLRSSPRVTRSLHYCALRAAVRSSRRRPYSCATPNQNNIYKRSFTDEWFAGLHSRPPPLVLSALHTTSSPRAATTGTRQP